MTETRIGFVGTGLRGCAHVQRVARHFKDRAQVAALADTDPDRLAACVAALPEPHPPVFADWRKLLALQDIDAVCISTPQFLHAEIARAAFASGRHVYCEKPLAITVADCEAMIEAARKAGAVFVVGQQMRYHGHLQRMREIVASGRIGAPQMAWLTEFRNPFPEAMAWAFDPGRSGGALVEKSCHHFDLFAWMHDRPARRVFASGGQAVHREIFGIRSGVIDHAWVTVEHEGGGRSMLGLCFFAGLPHRREGGAGTHLREIGVIGHHGMVLTEGAQRGRDLEIRHDDRADVERVEIHHPEATPVEQMRLDGNHGIWDDFLRCIETGDSPAAHAGIGRDAVAVALAAEQSLKTGQPVDVSSMA